jgi:hypothetical protein
MYTFFVKNPLLIIAFAVSSIVISCSGDNGARKGKDTVKSVYGSANDTTGSAQSTIDTAKVNSADSSASGGTKVTRDTARHHKPVKK